MSNYTNVAALIESVGKTNPELAEALRQMAADTYRMFDTLFPSVSGVQRRPGGVSGIIGDVENLVITPFPTNLRISWDVLANAFNYELRLGVDWATAQVLITTGSNVVNLDPISIPLIYGDYTFQVRGKDIQGNYSPNSAVGYLTVPQIAAPILTATTIANNALLSWTIPSSLWAIDYYIVKRNGVEIGQIKGTFKVQVEVVSGDYTYSIIAVDIVGNQSTESPTVTVTLTNPIDFEQLGVEDATYGGTYVNTDLTTIDGIQGVIGSIVEETWDDHFTNNVWTTIQDQIDAGYPKYFQPGNLSLGTYVEVFDFGAIFTNVRVVVQHVKQQLSGSTDVNVSIEVSDDNITYSAPVVGSVLQVASVRYVRVTWEFDNDTDLSLAFISELRVLLDVQIAVDSGSINALSTDVTGTPVTFNLPYRAIRSVTATAVNTVPYTVVIDTVTSTGFVVYVFNNAGVRVSTPVDWKAQGYL